MRSDLICQALRPLANQVRLPTPLPKFLVGQPHGACTRVDHPSWSLLLILHCSITYIFLLNHDFSIGTACNQVSTLNCSNCFSPDGLLKVLRLSFPSCFPLFRCGKCNSFIGLPSYLAIPSLLTQRRRSKFI